MTTSQHTIKISAEVDESIKELGKMQLNTRDRIWWSVKIFEFVVGVHIVLGVWRHW